MSYSEIMNKVLFDYSLFQSVEIETIVKNLPPKLLRWLGAHHPDNLTRKIFFRLTNIKIGEDTVINQNLIVSDNYLPLLRIGNRVAISPNVTIICASAPNNSLLSQNSYVADTLIVEKEVVIEDDVWIGAGVIILPGVVVGKGSVIGAGAVLSKNVLPGAVVAGVPGRQINNLF